MDLATIVGIILGFVLIIFGIIFDQDNMTIVTSNLGSFIDIPSIIITIGGTFSCLITMSQGFGDFVSKLKSIVLAFKVKSYNSSETIKQIIELSNVARKEGLLSLEEVANNIEDDFIKKGIMLIVDGTDPELVTSILDTELESINDRHKKVITFWENMAAMGPAWGMIGTLIGLVNMLGALDDPSSIGPSMAVALITTLYGSLMANWIATPIATKLKASSEQEDMSKQIIVEGLLSIQAGENPRVIEEKLKSFLAPKDRTSVGEEEA